MIAVLVTTLAFADGYKDCNDDDAPAGYRASDGVSCLVNSSAVCFDTLYSSAGDEIGCNLSVNGSAQPGALDGAERYGGAGSNARDYSFWGTLADTAGTTFCCAFEETGSDTDYVEIGLGGSAYGDTVRTQGTGYSLGDASPSGTYSANGLGVTVDLAQGNDTYVGTNTSDDVRETVGGGADADTITLNISGHADGEDGDDVLTGSDEADSLEGGLHDDSITANAGQDCVGGSTGIDTIYGNQDADELFAGTGNDVVHGNLGDDRIWGGDGNDDLYGTDGADIIRGHGDQDDLFGGPGDDLLCTGLGTNDVTAGGDGNDQHWAPASATNPTGTDQTGETNTCGDNAAWTGWVTNCTDSLSTQPSACATSAPPDVLSCSAGYGVPW